MAVIGNKVIYPCDLLYFFQSFSETEKDFYFVEDVMTRSFTYAKPKNRNRALVPGGSYIEADFIVDAILAEQYSRLYQPPARYETKCREYCRAASEKRSVRARRAGATRP